MERRIGQRRVSGEPRDGGASVKASKARQLAADIRSRAAQGNRLDVKSIASAIESLADAVERQDQRITQIENSEE